MSNCENAVRSLWGVHNQPHVVSASQTMQPSCGRPAITWIINRHNRLMVGVTQQHHRCGPLSISPYTPPASPTPSPPQPLRHWFRFGSSLAFVAIALFVTRNVWDKTGSVKIDRPLALYYFDELVLRFFPQLFPNWKTNGYEFQVFVVLFQHILAAAGVGLIITGAVWLKQQRFADA